MKERLKELNRNWRVVSAWRMDITFNKYLAAIDAQVKSLDRITWKRA